MTYRSHYYNLRDPSTPGRLESIAAKVSARAFEVVVVRSTPPAPPLDPSRYPHLHLVACPSYGTLTLASCRSRFGKANARPGGAGQGALDASTLRLSSCNGCATGAERCGRTRAR